MAELKTIGYVDCLLNAAIQLTSAQGNVMTTELQARAAQAEAWLHLAEALCPQNLVVDLDNLTVSVQGS